MKKAYLASRYQDYPLMQEWKLKLSFIEITVCSRWINGGHEIKKDAKSDEQITLFAEEDLCDIGLSDIFICRSDKSFFGSGRGGRHVELGIALALCKRIVLIGERENVFHWLPQVEVYGSIDKFILHETLK